MANGIDPRFAAAFSQAQPLNFANDPSSLLALALKDPGALAALAAQRGPAPATPGLAQALGDALTGVKALQPPRPGPTPQLSGLALPQGRALPGGLDQLMQLALQARGGVQGQSPRQRTLGDILTGR